MAGLRRFRPALPGGKNLLAGMQRPPVRLMQRMSPMIRDMSRYPPRCLVRRLRFSHSKRLSPTRAGPIIVERAAAIQHVAPCRPPDFDLAGWVPFLLADSGIGRNESSENALSGPSGSFFAR